MTESERANLAYGVFQTIARGYDAANERLSLGRQRRWKRAAIDGLRLKNTGRGLDLGCGTGDMLELLAERYPGMALVGLDFSPNMLQVAKERLAGFANVSLEQGDAMHLGYADGSFAANTSFLDMEVPRRTDALSTFIRSLYHHRGSLNPLCNTLAQGLWLAVLAMCAIAAFVCRRRPEAQALTLALLGATAYLLLFEVWPRYLFVFAPLYVLLATLVLDRPLLARGGEKRQKA